MKILTSIAVLFGLATNAIAETPAPIIDVHLHSQSVAAYGPPGKKFCTPATTQMRAFDPGAGRSWPEEWMQRNMEPVCETWVSQSVDDAALLRETLAVMERRNIIGILSGRPEMTAKWQAAAPDRIIRGLHFNLTRETGVTPEVLGQQYDNGDFDVLGEVTIQYSGLAPNDPSFADYWALAEEKDFPVGIHLGSLPPGSAYIFEGARISLGDPFLLEEVLVKHPKLRVYMMHAGYPHVAKTIAMLRQYPQLYVEFGVLPVTMPRQEFHAFLERLVRAGHGDRIMFGSDQMIWPGIIEASIEAVETADLTTPQKRDIFYNNAARFLRFDDETIARHHGR